MARDRHATIEKGLDLCSLLSDRLSEGKRRLPHPRDGSGEN